MNWKFFVRAALPFVEMAAHQFRDKDANDTGQDDMIGIALQFAADILRAAIDGTEMPKVPARLR